MGDKVSVTPEDFDRLSTTLRSSLDGLRGQAQTSPRSEVDAGVSTGAVSETLASIYDSIGKMVGDTEHVAGEVTDSGGEYTRSDDQAASELPLIGPGLLDQQSPPSDAPSVPLPPNGGH